MFFIFFTLIGTLVSTTPTYAQSPKTIVVGSGPGGTGFIKRALEHADCVDTFEWFEEGGNNLVLDWPANYTAPGRADFIKWIDRDAGANLMKAVRFSAFGGGAVLNSGGPLTLMYSDDERIQPAVDKHGRVFLAEELQSSVVTDPTSDRWIERYRDAGYQVEMDPHFLTTRIVNQSNRVGYGATTFAEGTRTQVAKTLLDNNPDRINLHLRTQVKRVIFGPSQHAIGVELMNGTKINGDRVVLAGGVFGTYELLVRSGIGSEKDLETVGVDAVVTDESVGKNIGDDAGILFLHEGGIYESNNASHGADVVASRGNEFGITHWGKVAYDTFLLPLQNGSGYEFLRPVTNNVSIVKVDMQARYESSLSMQDDGAIMYNDRDSYRDEICMNDVEFGILKQAHPPPSLITNVASLFGIVHSTPDKRCSSGQLLSEFHYHGGTQGITNNNFSVKGTQNLYISDASVTDGYNYGAPTTNVYMIGYAVADAIYTSVPRNGASKQHCLIWVVCLSALTLHNLL